MGLLAQADFAVADELPDHPPVDASHFERLTNADGLSQVSISAILQDQQGLMWFGSSDGLNRFDGYEFKVFYHEPSDPNSLSNRRIRTLYEDGGYLWIGTDGGGLNLFDPVLGRFTHLRHDPLVPDSLSHDKVYAVLRDRAGSLWVGTDHGLNRMSKELPERFTHFFHRSDGASSLSHDRVNALLEDLNGNLWIATHGGLDRFDADRQEIRSFRHDNTDPHSLGANQTRALAQDTAGNLWIGTHRGLDLRTTEGFAHFLPVPDQPSSAANDISAIEVAAGGRLWIGTQGGLFRFDPGTGRFSPFPFATDNSPAKKAVAAMQVDDSGALWLGTWISGIYHYDPNRARFGHIFHQPDDPDSLFYDTVYGFAEDHKGNLWVGTAGGGINRYDPDTRSFRHYRHDPGRANSLSGNLIRCLLADRQDNLWIGTRDSGLNRLDPERRQFTRYRHDPSDPYSLADDQVLALEEDQRGFLWIGTKSGLDRYDPSTNRFDHPDLFTSTTPPGSDHLVMAITEDRAGTLWIGSRSGLFHHDGESIHLYAHDPADPSSLSHDHVLSILEDRAGYLWIGTGGGGLNRFDPNAGTFSRFTASDGLGNNVVYGILQDDLGKLWISTNRGLVRFDPESRRWNQYDRNDGLQGNEFNVGAAFRSANGTLYFGGVRGFNTFRAEQFSDNPYIPPVVLTSFEVLQRGSLLTHPSSSGPTMELSYKENFFSFEFAALNYTRPDKNLYSYRLVGLDDDWLDSAHRRYASYTNVPPGRYTFRVRGSNNDGVWNERGASIELVIRPPWWRTWWANTLLGVVLMTILGGAVFNQRRKLLRERAIAERERQISSDLEIKNAELERFVYTVSHDLKNPLVTIRNYIGMVQQNLASKHLASADDSRILRDLGRIDKASAHMHQMLEELLELSRIGRVILPTESVHLGQLAQEAAEMLAKSNDQDHVQLVVDSHLPAVQVDRLRILEVLQNLLENALKFMGDQPNPRIEVGQRKTTGPFGTFFVSDNGIGIDSTYHDRVFGLFERLDPEIEGTGTGLALVKRIIEAHEGEIWIESAGCGHGSAFCFTLPLA